MATTPAALALDNAPVPDRAGLVRRARVLAWIGVGWHMIEAGVALVAGIAAGSIALVGFGADSLIEAAAGFVVLWRFAATRTSSARAERDAQRAIAASFYVLAIYVAVEALRSLIGTHEPDVSWIGIGLAAVALATMPWLARAKARVGARLGSAATTAEGRQNMLCAYLSAALLVGLGTNALFGWWWADPATALLVAVVAVREGRAAWAGEDCCTTALLLDTDACSDGCCTS
ncbi:MAG TPA: cation transporter [Conexibacter sp.]|nr:cation transporter [Conexibacter sp.]